MGDRQWPHPLDDPAFYEPSLSRETTFAPGRCGLCGRDPAAGFASVGDVWFCHGDLDPEPTCYMRAQGATGPAGGPPP